MTVSTFEEITRTTPEKSLLRPLKKHADCGGPVNKVFHASGVVFKGPGFYATDNRSAKSAGTSTKPSGSDTSASSKAEGSKKTESSKSNEGKKKASKATADSSD